MLKFNKLVLSTLTALVLSTSIAAEPMATSTANMATDDQNQSIGTRNNYKI